ncbi:MAG TPA: glycerol-3-phosphate 1-O-acyltransferase PlsY [Terriglobales bacterium]|jgi:glycerol-3-phosphate acyltransferase PlsY
MNVLLIAALSYLLGSIPFGYVLVRILRGQDIRKTGSGNIGATNVSRTSPALGILTLVLDAGKGVAAVLLAQLLFPGLPLIAVVAAVFAILGHIFPVWLRFRGGKGVATGLGSFVVLVPKAILVMVCVFVLLLVMFRYVSLASIVSVALLPLLAWQMKLYFDVPLVLGLMTIASFLIVAKHHENIRRLLAGSEPRLQLRRG